jgi:membrane-associated phospholipid phosphatase
MWKKLTSIILHCRLEDIAAATFSLALLIFFLTTSYFHSFQINGHDIIFILLPMGVLGVKSLLHILFSNESDPGESGTGKYLTNFFKPLLKIVRDWSPFILLSACYYALYTNLLLRVNPHTADGLLSRLDAALLGDQASLLLQPLIRPWLTDFFYVVYFSYVFSLPTVALFLYLKKKEAVFRRVMMGYLTLMLMGVTSYLLVPAIGPEKFFASQFTSDLQGQAVSRGVFYIINAGRVAYDCFPSLHVGIPLLLSFYLRDYRKKLFYPGLLYVASMCGATIYLRYHYVTDVIAAFFYAPAAYWLNDYLLARWPGERIIAKSTIIPSTSKPNNIADAEPT